MARIVTIALVAGILAACGSADPTPPPGGSPAAAPAGQAAAASPDDAGRRIDPRRGGFELGFGEFAITMEAEVIRPGPVTFLVRNGGALVHGFEIEGEDGGDHSGSGHGGFKLEGEAFGPGEVVRIRADLRPGVYEIECFVAEHDDRGMRAFLTVRPGAPLVRADDGPASDDAVQISDFAFGPETIDVAPGTEVTWSNDDPAPHTVSAEGGGFDSGTLEPGQTFATVFEQPGRFPYVCRIHPTMRGVVRVG